MTNTSHIKIPKIIQSLLFIVRDLAGAVSFTLAIVFVIHYLVFLHANVDRDLPGLIGRCNGEIAHSDVVFVLNVVEPLHK